MAKGGTTGPNGGASFNFDGKAIADAIVMGCADGTANALIVLQRELRNSLSKPGGGRKHDNLPRRSSAPGRPPAAQTGFLRNSWQSGQPTRIARGRTLGWALGSPVPYARGLEFGTRRIFPRPYLRPAIRAILPQVGKLMSDAIMRRLAPFNARRHT